MCRNRELLVRSVILATLLLLLLLPLPSHADPGDLDPDFGKGGVVRVAPASSIPPAALAVDDAGRILVAGSVPSNGATGRDFGVLRFLPNGQPDLAFGIGGRVTTPVTAQDDSAGCLVVLTDGRIVVGGVGGDARHAYPTLARYLTTGALDPTFGMGGVARVPELPKSQGVRCLFATAGGTLTLVDYGRRYTRVARLLPDGALDRSFGRRGLTQVQTYAQNIFGFYAEIAALHSESDILTVAVGFSKVAFEGGGFALDLESERKLVLFRLGPTGKLDPTFGRHGTARDNHSRIPDVGGIIGTPGGGLVIGGRKPNGFFTARYTADGRRDRAYGMGGMAGRLVPERNARPVSVLASGVEGGVTLVSGSFGALSLVRFQADGASNPDFGEDGLVSLSIPDLLRTPVAVALPGGKVIVAGVGAEENLILSRLLLDPELE